MGLATASILISQDNATGLRAGTAAWRPSVPDDRETDDSGEPEGSFREPEPRTSPDIEPIPRGRARLVVTAGFLEVLASMHRLEAARAAVAQQLDAAATTEAKAP